MSSGVPTSKAEQVTDEQMKRYLPAESSSTSFEKGDNMPPDEPGRAGQTDALREVVNDDPIGNTVAVNTDGGTYAKTVKKEPGEEVSNPFGKWPKEDKPVPEDVFGNKKGSKEYMGND